MKVERVFPGVIVIESAAAVFPFSCEQVFDLVADIEHYPEFLRFWLSAHIQKRESNICYVEQVMGIGPIRLEFVSQAVLHRPQRINITSNDRLFRQYNLSWVVAAAPPSGCRVQMTAQVELQSGFLRHTVNRLLPAAIGEIIAAFEARARVLYGTTHA